MNLGSLSLIPVGFKSDKIMGKLKSKNALADNFSNILKDSIDNLNNLQKEADKKIIDFAKGDVKSIHDVTIAVSKADIALSLAIEIRNRVLEAYKEITRMQI